MDSRANLPSIRELRRQLEKSRKDPNKHRRLTFVLSCLEGEARAEVCQKLRLSRSSYFSWKHQLVQSGLTAFLTEKPRGRPRSHPPQNKPAPSTPQEANAIPGDRIMPTLREVAKAAGVSVCTASLALRDSGNVHPNTAQRVRKAARGLEYRPNPLVGIHMAHVRMSRASSYRATLACLVDHSETLNPTRFKRYGLTYFDSARTHARRHGYEVELFHFNSPEMTNSRLRDILIARGIRGLFFTELAAARGKLNFDLTGFCVALVGYTIWEPFNLHRVCGDTFNIMTNVLREVAARGYRRIGMVTPNDERANYLVGAAIRVFHAQLPKARRVEPYLPDQLDVDRSGFMRWFRRVKPDAVVSWNGSGYQWLKEDGWRFPEDLGFAAGYVDGNAPELSGNRLNLASHGPAAVDLIINQLQLNETGVPAHPKTVLMPGEWQEGGTLRPALQ